MEKILTFDCYGTLVDTASFLDEVGRIGQEHGLDAQRVKAVYEIAEARVMYAEPFRRLDKLILAALQGCDTALGTSCMAGHWERLLEAERALKAFPEVPAVLEELKKRGYRLVILSNSCHSIMAHNLHALGDHVEEVLLAEDVGAYKPQLGFFQMAQQRFDLKNKAHWHIAQGYFHDIIPSTQLGWRKIWVNRNGERGLAAHGPYSEVRSLDEVLALLD